MTVEITYSFWFDEPRLEVFRKIVEGITIAYTDVEWMYIRFLKDDGLVYFPNFHDMEPKLTPNGIKVAKKVFDDFDTPYLH